MITVCSFYVIFWLFIGLLPVVVSLRLLLHPARMLVGFLALFALLLNRVVFQVFLVFVFDVESLEEAVEVEVLEIVGAEGQLGDDKVDVLVLQFQFLEHLDQALAGDRLLSVLDVFEGNLKLPRISAGHLCYPNDHLLLLVLLHQLKVVDDLAQLGDQGRVVDGLIGLDFVGLEAIGEEGLGVVCGEVEGFVDEHVAEVGVSEGACLGGFDVAFDVLEGVSLRFHAVCQQLLDLGQHLFVGLVGLALRG